MQVLSPQLIILRVAMGRGWSSHTAKHVSTELAFARRDGGTVSESAGYTDNSSAGAVLVLEDMEQKGDSVHTLRSAA